MEYDVALFGGSGFLGSHLLERFLKSGFRVLVLGRHAPKIVSSDIAFEKFDVNELLRVAPASRTVRTVIYNAAIKGRFASSSPEETSQARVNAPDFQKLFEVAGLTPERIVTLGSSEEYGARYEPVEILEDDPAAPLSSYGVSKVALAQAALKWCHDAGATSIHLRPFVIYGCDQDPSMFIESLARTLKVGGSFPMTLGEQWRSFVSIDVVTQVIETLCRLQSWQYPILNVSTDNYFQISDVAKMLHRIIPGGKLQIGALPYRAQEVWHQKPSLERFKAILPDIRWNSLESDLRELFVSR